MSSRLVRPAAVPLVVAGGLSIVAWVLGITRHRWASRVPDSEHPYGVRFRGDEMFFFSTPVGWWLDNGLWVFFAALTVAVLADLRAKKAPR